MHKLLVAVATIFQVAYLHAQSRTVPMQSTTGFPTGLLLCAVFVALMGTESVSQAPNSSAGSFALVGGTIHVSPSEEPIRDGTVLIQGETIAAVGSKAAVELPGGTRILDCSGLTIAAGFWNSHVHFFERKWADATTIPAAELSRQLQDALTRYGFSSVFDTGSVWENTRAIRDRIESGEVPGPRIRSTGAALVPPGALPSETVLDMMGSMRVAGPEIADAAQAAAASRRLLERGVDGIKLFTSSRRTGPLPQSAIEAAVNEARMAGKPAFVHPNDGADVLAAVQGGVDVIAHTTPHSGAWDERILATMMQGQVALVPTLWLWKYYARHDRRSVQDAIVDAGVRQLRGWVGAGGEVLFGTDLGAVDPDPGEEYDLMAEAGMTFRQILASLTTSPAERFGESERLGRVAPGLEADLVVLNDDPSENLRALTAVRYTLRAGEVIYRAD